MVAFQRAVDMGYGYLETDVHATSDGQLIAFHDDELDRVTDRSGKVAQLPWAEVARAKIDGREPIPLLAELLDAFPATRFNIDAKSDAAVEPLVEILRKHKVADQVLVASFDQQRLRRVRRQLPGIATSAGPWEVRALKAAAMRLLPIFAIPSKAVAVQVPEYHDGRKIVDRGFVRTAHKAGMQVHVWTINDAVTMHRLLDQGVDGIVTDDIATLQRVLRERTKRSRNKLQPAPGPEPDP